AVVNKSIFGETLDRFHWETSFTYGLTQAKLHLFHYGLNFLWPMGIMEGLRIEPARLSEPGPWLGLAFILSTLILAGWVRKTRPLIAFCILAYWALMAVTSSIFPPGPTGATDYASDYRPYPASMFLYLAGATAAFTYFNRKWFGAGTVVLVAAFSSATLYLNTTWKTEESFWRRAIERDASHLAHVAYARTQKDRAVQEKHLRQALQLKPHYTLARINLGLNLIHQGRKRQGLAEVEKAVEGAPDIPQHQYMLAVAYTLTGRTESAFRAARAAARLDPKNIKHLFLAGLLTQRVGRMEESLPYLNAVLALEP
ncbi:MAG: hypothetical protein GWM98_10515, partial [Nitrospinaceae bacterium]|nr:hypothetical protein [Nitrospinaceae bacterium]NIR54844.1 hypothetical protein [Nitrospinaceae bacterium]NIS85269.1 hypothetical protein [Nitrospinaceae bacterium]NIT82082.1 hypothetical protein [Nitrospinaceae bacterium]NIU44343.1 hypothetical protein [Nitrospinaceae bacterium]